MRRIGFLSAALALLLTSPVYAQGQAVEWKEFVDRGEFFTVNLPGEPAKQDITYKTDKGTSLPAKI